MHRTPSSLIFLLTLAALTTTIPAADPQQPSTYLLAATTIPAPGTVIETKTTTAMPQGSIRMVKNGDSTVGSIDETEVVERTTTVLDPKKIRTLTTKSDHFWTTTIKDHADKSVDPPDALTRQPVLTEEKEPGKWTSTLESGRKPTEEEEKALAAIDPAQDLATEAALYGLTPHQPGDKWEVDLSKVHTFIFVTQPTGKLSAEFVKTLDLAGENCAEIRLTFDLTGTAGVSDSTDDEMKVHLKGEKLLHRSLQDHLDRDWKATLDSDVTGSNDQYSEIQILSHGTMKQTAKVSKAKP